MTTQSDETFKESPKFKFNTGDNVTITCPTYNFHNGRQATITEQCITKRKPWYKLSLDNIGIRQYYETELELTVDI